MGDAARLDDRLKSRLPYILLASVAMGITVYSVQNLMGDAFITPIWRYLALFGLVLSGIISYGIFLVAFGAVSRNDVKGFIKRG